MGGGDGTGEMSLKNRTKRRKAEAWLKLDVLGLLQQVGIIPVAA
jgi:hypothetical protein